MDKLHRVACDGVEIEYEAHGAGEHVVLVHHGVGIDWFTPLLEEPALSGRFCDSDPRFRQRQQLLLEWLQHVEPFILAGAGHLLHVEQPTQLATALSSFFSRHSSGVAT